MSSNQTSHPDPSPEAWTVVNRWWLAAALGATVLVVSDRTWLLFAKLVVVRYGNFNNEKEDTVFHFYPSAIPCSRKGKLA
jgi:hypothetical protein